MTVIVILEVKAKPGTGNDLVSTFKELLPDTRAYEGIIDINVLQNQDDPDSLIAYERWETRKHYEKYLAWNSESDQQCAWLLRVSNPQGPPNL